MSGLTASCWVNMNTVSDYNIVYRGNSFTIGYRDDTNGFFGEITDSANAKHTVRSGSSVSTGVWKFVTLAYDGDELRVYVDASLSNTTSTNGNSINSTARGFRIGRLDGSVDDVRAYSRPLSQPEIEALYNLGQPSGFLVEERDVPTYPEPAALARYEFEGDVADSWGDNDGTDNTSAGFVDGVFGQAKDFDGSDDYINPGTPVPDDEVTFSAWIYPQNLGNGTNHAIMGVVNTSPTRLMQFHYNDSGGGWDWKSFDGSNPGGIVSASVGASTNNQWYHMVGTKNRDVWRLYVNGSIKATGDDIGTPHPENDFYIGGDNNDGTADFFFDGYIEDFRMYNRALDPIEVETLYQLGAYRIPRGEI